MTRPLVHGERERHVHSLRGDGRRRLHLHVAKSEVAVITLQPGASRSIVAGGKRRPRLKGNRLERSRPPLRRNARELHRRDLRRAPLVDQDRQRRGVVRELDRARW